MSTTTLLSNRKLPRKLSSGHGPCDALAEAEKRGEIKLSAFARGCYPGRRLPDGCLPGLSSVGFWDAPGEQSWGLSWHRHEGLEIEFLETGRMDFGVAGGEMTDVVPGQITITRPWQSHRYGDPNIRAGRLHWFIIDVGVYWPNQEWRWPEWVVLSQEDQKQLADLLRYNETTVLFADKNVQKNFLNIGRTVSAEDNCRTISRLAVQINELLLNILGLLQNNVEELDDSLTTSRRATELFLDELQTNLDSLRRPWTVKKMATACGIGQTQFTTYCRQYTNKSPADFLKNSRLNAGRELLTCAPDMTISNIAQACGFGSAEYFATLFKLEYGIAPSEYRNFDRET